MSKLKQMSARLAAVAGAFLVTVFFTSGFFGRAGAETKDYKAMAEEVIILVNEAREEAGLKPLYMVPYLCDLSHIRARECMTRFSHYRPSPDGQADIEADERIKEIKATIADPIARNEAINEIPEASRVTFISILDDSLVPYTRAAENIAAGSDNAEDTFNQWKNSPSHWAAIMNPEYTHIGVAVSYDQNSAYKYYWEQFFVATDKKLDNQVIPERYKTVPKSSGDIDGDADINAFDLITINQYLADDTAFLNDLQVSSADMLKDGVITSADAMVLRKYLLGEYKTLPVTLDMLIGG